MDNKQAAAATRELLLDYDPADPATTANALRTVWLQAAPSAAPDLDANQEKLMRDWGIHDPHYEAAGVPVPVLSAMGKQVGNVGEQDVERYLPLTRLLWDKYGREGRIVAVTGLGPMELAEPDAVVPIVYEMAQTCVFWEDCDQLAMRALEPVLRRDPDAWLEPIGRWVLDENKWVRRAGLTALGRLPMKQPAYTERCVALEAPALGDPDTDVKRGLSFAVRLCARGDVEPVKRFVVDNQGATDADSLWVLCDVIRSMTRSLLPRFVDLLPIYEAWLETAEPRARRSVQGAIRTLEGAT